MKYSKEEYNAEPVHFCKNCLSLSIKALNTSEIYVCRDCGNIYKETDEETNIEEYNLLYTKEYGKPFLSKEDELVE